MTEYLKQEDSSVRIQTLDLNPEEPLVLPENFKSTLNLENGGNYAAIHFEGMVLLTSLPLVTPQALDRMGQALQTAHVSLDDLLTGLGDIRTQMLRERYGILST